MFIKGLVSAWALHCYLEAGQIRNALATQNPGLFPWKPRILAVSSQRYIYIYLYLASFPAKVTSCQANPPHSSVVALDRPTGQRGIS